VRLQGTARVKQGMSCITPKAASSMSCTAHPMRKPSSPPLTGSYQHQLQTGRQQNIQEKGLRGVCVCVCVCVCVMHCLALWHVYACYALPPVFMLFKSTALKNCFPYNSTVLKYSASSTLVISGMHSGDASQAVYTTSVCLHI
jgi:hypothetical protein